MYFCFDLLGQNAEDPASGPFETVAITCPNKKLAEKPKIRKCCQHGEVLDSTLDSCVNGSSVNPTITDRWKLQINGYLHNGYEGQFQEKGILSPYNKTEQDASKEFHVSIKNAEFSQGETPIFFRFCTCLFK